MTRLHIIGAYRDLDTHGIINYDALGKNYGSNLANDWWLVATDYLTDGMFSKIYHGIGFVLCVFFVFSISGIYIYRRMESLINCAAAAGK